MTPAGPGGYSRNNSDAAGNTTPQPSHSPASAPTSLWGDRVRLLAGRVSPLLAQILDDGRYLMVWPVGRVAPILALLAGLLLGAWHHWPFVSYSLAVMGVLVAIATFGAALGAWLGLGYLVGDFGLVRHIPRLTYAHRLTALLHVRLPLVIGYAVLEFLLAFIPLAGVRFRDQLWHSARNRASMTPGLRAALAAAPAAVLVFAWTLAAPVLIRPLFTWDYPPLGRFSKYPIEAFRPLQHWGWVLALVAAAAAVGRVRLEDAARRAPQFAGSVRAEPLPPRRSRHRLPPPVRFLLAAAVATFFMAGLISNWSEAVILASFFVLAAVVRGAIGHTPAAMRTLTGMSLLARLGATAGLSFLIACLVLRGRLDEAPTFLPLIYALGASLLVSAVLLPGRAAPSNSVMGAAGSSA